MDKGYMVLVILDNNTVWTFCRTVHLNNAKKPPDHDNFSLSTTVHQLLQKCSLWLQRINIKESCPFLHLKSAFFILKKKKRFPFTNFSILKHLL